MRSLLVMLLKLLLDPTSFPAEKRDTSWLLHASLFISLLLLLMQTK